VVATHALSGVRVLDLATLFPAPLLAAMLGDLGADVVKVEPPEGDPLRRVGPARGSTPVAWTLAGRNKRSVVVDDVLAFALAAAADVVVVNESGSRLARRGWTYDALRDRNPNIVFVSVTAFGATGPYAERPGNGSVVEAFGGFAHLNGEPEGSPTLPSVALGDTLTAIAGLNQVLAALYERDARGAVGGAAGGAGGAFIDVAMYEPILALLASPIVAWDGATSPPERSGSRIAGAAPRNVYRCADGGWIALSGPTDAQVARVLVVIGMSAATDRWGRASQRVDVEADALDAAVAAWIGARPRAAVLDAFLSARIPVAPANDLADLAADPHVRARGSLDAVRGVQHRRAPEIGEHTAEVLADWLGR